MQNIIVLKPYRFVPPYLSPFWIRSLGFYLPLNLRREWGLHTLEYRGTEHLKASLAAGHSIILAPNHCRPFDPLTVGMLGGHMRQPFFTMASWHLFMEGRFKRWLIRRIGGFSIYREGVDREALKAATALLVAGRRPLVMFAEGVISRTNDRINPLQDGVAFIARAAAKVRGKANPPGKVIVHPVFLRYYFEGDLAASVTPVLEEIEKRLSWRSQKHLSLFQRVRKIGVALLALKEVEYLGEPQPGSIAERLSALIERVLAPLEKEWLGGYRDPSVIERVKRLRMAIVPEMIAGNLSEEEIARRWRKLGDAYLAQQLYCYPPDYLTETSPPERLLETVERFEEDLDDVARIHRPLRVVISIAPAIEVNPTRERGAAEDPLMKQVRESLEQMMLGTRREARPL